MVLKRLYGLCLSLILLLFLQPGWAQGDYREEPMSQEQMGEYQEIPFSAENFEKVTNGMTQEQVLSLLGRPLDLRKEQRRRGRWTVHYLYPEGHVVNFRSGLVVGKEKQ